MAPGIATLLRMMPDGYEEACFSTGAIVRKRDIKSPDDLMMLCLFHLLTGCSLIKISELAKLSEIGDISDVAFMKRFSKQFYACIKVISTHPNDRRRSFHLTAYIVDGKIKSPSNDIGGKRSTGKEKLDKFEAALDYRKQMQSDATKCNQTDHSKLL